MKVKKESIILKGKINLISSLPPFCMFKYRSLLIAVIFIAGILFTRCTTYEEMDQHGVTSLNTPESEKEFLEEWLESNELMAYVMNDNNNIYVHDEAINDIQAALKATIENGVWLYQNSQGKIIQRNQKPLNLKDYSNRAAIIKWSYARGYDCQERPKGFKLPIHQAGDRNRKIIAAYETTEKENWCIDNRSSTCKFGWKKVTARFIKVNKNGKLRKRRGKYLRYKEKTMTIMVCVK